MRIHVDTDFAGDTDDAAALVMLLGLPGVEVVGVTTVADPDGRRAAYAKWVLEQAGRAEVPVAVGAGASSTTGQEMGGLPDHARYWQGPDVTPLDVADGGAVELVERSVGAGAVVAGIGPFTNLAAADLGRAHVVVMGGWLTPPAPGWPAWGPDFDWNVQCDTRAAEAVLAGAASLTLVTLTAAMGAHLRRAHLPRLRASGPLGRLVARQAEAHASDDDVAELAAAHPRLPDDLLNFQWDPVACAVAAGVADIATVERLALRARTVEGVLRFERHPDGRPVDVVTAVDDEAFAEVFLTAVERADST